MSNLTAIHVLHENDAWLPPLRSAFAARGLSAVEWHLADGWLDLDAPPPPGVFYNRMSASAHSRGHRFAPEYTAQVIAWLELHGRRVINGRRALQLEVSKIEQYAALRQHEILTPKTCAAVGRDAVIAAAEAFDGPYILKHNRAGKGLGVQLFDARAALVQHVRSDDFETPIDGITLVQRYIEAPDASITRCEFVGGRFFYAVRVDTSDGFELCPAEACRVDDAPRPPMFAIDEDFDDPVIERYEAFLAANNIDIAGIEFVRNRAGTIYTYDVNTNTNYNPEAEAAAGLSGMGAIADLLSRELDGLRTDEAA